MNKFKYSKKSRFRLTSPELLFVIPQNPHLSLKAKGLFLVMSAIGECTLTELFEKSRDDSYAVIKKTLHELEHFNLLSVKEVK